MRLDHLSYAAGPEGLASCVQRLGARLGAGFTDGGIHPTFGTRNFVLALADEYVVRELVYDPAYFARSAELLSDQGLVVAPLDQRSAVMRDAYSQLFEAVNSGTLLHDGDEVLIPSPDYPLWTAATVLNGGRAVYYPCPESQGFNPDPDAIEKLITPRTRAIVIINPNNPTGAVYSRERLTALARISRLRRTRRPSR